MGRKRIPGLYKRQGIWHVDKVVFGRRLCESTGTGDAEEAERFLARITESIRQQVVYGVRPDRTFREAATKYLNETCKRSLARDAQDLAILDRYIGDLRLRQVHRRSPFATSSYGNAGAVYRSPACRWGEKRDGESKFRGRATHPEPGGAAVAR